MKRRILFLLSVFVFFVFVFMLFKAVFALVHASMGGGVSIADLWQILCHGLPLDLSMSGYLTILPALITIASLWISNSVISRALNVYFAVFISLLSLIFIADLAIYPYWGYHFDSSIFLYLQNPIDSLASASFGEMALAVFAFLLFAIGLFLMYKFTLSKQVDRFTTLKGAKTILPCVVLLLLSVFLFLPIRGGLSVSTMNVGKAYFSDNMFFNHAAINPHFNLMYSMTKSEDFGSQYQFFRKEKASEIFDLLTVKEEEGETLQLLKTERPNIVLFLLESFSEGVAFDSVVAPSMVKLANEGVRFSNFYANSFRTDRGMVSILSGYPAHPTVALMKYPQKTQSLPTIPKSLINNGYSSSFYYGGDVDFANMRSYIIGACATSDVHADKDFPIAQRMTKWGVPDKYLLERVYDDLMASDKTKPSITTVLTLSSHEPFDVPGNLFDEPFLNAVNYTDEQIGIFVDKLKKSDRWDNTLLIFLADHCMQSYPVGVSNFDASRFHIPMVWAGGALKGKNTVISDFGAQNDLAATLLGQLNVDYSDYIFSNNMLNSAESKFAFYSYSNGFSMLDSTGVVVYDNDAEKALKQEGNTDLEAKAKAFFQTMYIDLGER